MNRTLRLGTLLVLAIAACGGGGGDDADGPPAGNDSTSVDSSTAPDGRPDAVVADARPLNLACPTDVTVIPEGTTSLTLSGTIVDTGGDGVADATVDVFVPGSETPLGTATSAADGTYSITSPVTPGDPAPTPYVRVRHADYVTNFLFPADPVAENLTFDPIMFDPGSLNLLYTVLGDTKRSDTASTTATLMVDCGFDPIDGAVFTSTPAAEKILYIDTSSALPAPEADGNTAPNGLALGLNVPLGTVSVGGSYGALTMESHDVITSTDGENPAITTTIVHPPAATP